MKNITNDNQFESPKGENHIKLSENESGSLEGDIKYSEPAKALNIMKRSKTPENDYFSS